MNDVSQNQKEAKVCNQTKYQLIILNNLTIAMYWTYNGAMKNALSILFGLILVSTLNAQSLQEVRKRFHQAVLDPENISIYHQFITEVTSESPTIVAYRAAGEAMMSQTMWNPIRKFSQVNLYEKLIQEAISKDADNLEIHFLRFAIEFHLPRILLMSKHLDEDRDFIMDNLWRCKELNIDPAFEQYITYFMNDTGLLLPDQVTKIKSILSRPTGS